MKLLFVLFLLVTNLIAHPDDLWFLHVYTNGTVDTHLVSEIDSITFGKYYTGIPGDTLVDVRNGQRYATIQIGTQLWMAENLNIGTYVQSTNTGATHSEMSDNGIIEKFAYNNDTTNFALYGGFYDWNEATQYDTTEGTQGICPDGWHIPTEADWQTLEINGGMLPRVAITTGYRGNTEGRWLKKGGPSGFNALLTGFRYDQGYFMDLNLYSIFWSSSQRSSLEAWIRRVKATSNQISKAYANKMRGMCVRCLKD